jgi:hypothetical protein
MAEARLYRHHEVQALSAVDQREFRSRLMFITRRVVTTALSLTGLAALAGFSPLRLIADALAQSAVPRRQASIAAGDGARSRQHLGNDHRIFS